jgi:hypothetical protein
MTPMEGPRRERIQTRNQLPVRPTELFSECGSALSHCFVAHSALNRCSQANFVDRSDLSERDQTLYSRVRRRRPLYASPMPPFRNLHNDADIADIIDYQRSACIRARARRGGAFVCVASVYCFAVPPLLGVATLMDARQ